LEKKIGKAWVDPNLNLFGKKYAAYYSIFYAHVHAYSPSYTVEE